MGKGAQRNIKTASTKKKAKESDSEESMNSDNDADSSRANTSVAADRTDDTENISESVENLADKRASTRESGLKGVLKALRSTNQLLVDSVSGFTEAIGTALAKMLRRPGSVKEGTMCLQVYSLMSLVAGPDETDLFDQFEQLLIKIINGGSNFEELRVAAISALAFSSYICANEAQYRVMTLCEDVLCGESEGEPATAALKARAAASWSLVASINSEVPVLTRCKERIFEELVELLEEGESEVKISVGSTFGVLWDIADNVAPDVDWRISGLELCDNPAKVAQAVSILQKVSKESSKRISKKDRKEQVHNFVNINSHSVI
jgi:Interferon-related developmental regulator (IFRD)